MRLHAEAHRPLFNNLPIERKLLLTAVIPLLALILSSILTYRAVHTFAENEEQLDRVYLTQRTASEYMRLVLELNSGFRGFVLARQDGFLEPYRVAHDHIAHVGDTLEDLVQDLPPQFSRSTRRNVWLRRSCRRRTH